jgi:glycosyltransferase involved in cell wall biosynthesis
MSRRTPGDGPVRVATAQRDQYYHRLLYDQLRPWVHDIPLRPGHMSGADDLSRDADIFHLHSPEDLPLRPDVGEHGQFADNLRRSQIRVVWTQHNFHPHDAALRAAYRPVYAEWAGRADSVIHHSRWGMRECLARFPFRPDARHFVVPHGHFGSLMPELRALDPGDCRAALGLDPGKLCLGIIGHPREEKQAAMAMRAFAAAGREDMQLLALSLTARDLAPAHPSIVGLRHTPAARPEYNRRLRAIDVALMPFAPGMLTTGSIGDVIAMGVPAITSDWPFLAEILGSAGIVYGAGEDALRQCISGLTAAQVSDASSAVPKLQERYAYSAVALAALRALRRTVTR